MNMLPLGLAAALLATTSQATIYQAADNSIATRICMDAAANKPARMLRTADDISYGYSLIANRISCNGLPIGRFAQAAGSDRVARQLLPRSHQRTWVEIHDIGAVIKVSGRL
ncbi:DUF3718 domain-containing protein [Gallaecimonas sp. GXIMD4217]|uniref:DUF3718 domain-containing protein n=1 Tax=Gallaecimonas sp. GXIMD4217 TaxID=3131927 RepID=UPI00311ACBAE